MPRHSPSSPARTTVRILLGSSLVVAGVTHLTVARDGFQAQVPDFVPLDPDTTVLASGVVEITLGALIASGWKRVTVGWIAAAFFVAIFPGNIAQYVHQRDGLGLDSDAKRLARLPFQVPLILSALWSTGAWRDRRQLLRRR